MIIKKGRTFVCEKCRYAITVNSNEDIKKIREHSKICDGKFTIAVGKCIPIALDIAKRYSCLFCYGRVKRGGGNFIHAWNETKGHIEIVNEIPIVKAGGEDIILDFSGSFKIVSEPEIYYERKEIDKLTIKKISYSEASKKIKRAKRKGKNLYHWIK